VYSLLIMVCSLEETALDGERVRTNLCAIREMVVTNGYYLWLVNSFFLRIADRLPSQLREMTNIIDDIIINELIWQEDGVSAQIMEMYHSNCTQNSSLLALTQKLMAKVESHVSRIMAEFSEIDSCEQMEAEIDKTVKYILLHAPEVFRDHNLLTTLLCSAYLVFRTNGLAIKFNEIVMTFQQVNRLRPADYKRLVNEI
jgi:hypothetical protein